MKFALGMFPVLALLNLAAADAAPMRPDMVSEVYSYGCKFNFPEGEGVTENSVHCLPGQNLGMYQAEYKFYLYQHSRGSNFPGKGTSELYPSFCGVRLERYVCDSGEPQLEFGLSAVRDRDFPIAVSLYPAPQKAAQIVGFAAPVNHRGDCPDGLVKVRPYFAYPPSMVSPLPSAFINRNGILNAIQVTTSKPDPFLLTRTPAAVPCDEHGNCSYPGGESRIAAEAAYVAASPVVCAIAPEELR